jgi:para-aminobenzoate synthetase / 4-amino-4-deoxychorismate lyase
VSEALAQAVSPAVGPQRVRLLLNRHGEPRVECAALELTQRPLRLGLASRSIDPGELLLFHKTTNREHLERARRPGYDETVLWNRREEITEGIITNLVVEIDGRRITPPVECGLLPGTMRAELLARGEIVEGRLTVSQLTSASRVWAINSVRGWCDAVLDLDPRPA